MRNSIVVIIFKIVLMGSLWSDTLNYNGFEPLFQGLEYKSFKKENVGDKDSVILIFRVDLKGSGISIFAPLEQSEMAEDYEGESEGEVAFDDERPSINAEKTELIFEENEVVKLFTKEQLRILAERAPMSLRGFEEESTRLVRGGVVNLELPEAMDDTQKERIVFGFTEEQEILYIAYSEEVYLKDLAEVMKNLGCYSAESREGTHDSMVVVDDGTQSQRISSRASSCLPRGDLLGHTNLVIYAYQPILSMFQSFGGGNWVDTESIEEVVNKTSLEAWLYNEKSPAYHDSEEDLCLNRDVNIEQSLKRAEDFLAFSSLTPLGHKLDGATEGGVYQDENGVVWFVKESQYTENEYLGATLFRLFLGAQGPQIKLIWNRPMLVASKNILGFKRADTLEDSTHSLLDKAKLDLAMDLIGLIDRSRNNLGYVETQDGLLAMRVDFDFSFCFEGIKDTWGDLKSRKLFVNTFKRHAWKDLEKGVDITSVSDGHLEYLLNESFRNLYKVNPWFESDRYVLLIEGLKERKAVLKSMLEYLKRANVFFEQSPEDLTESDMGAFQECIDAIFEDEGMDILHVAAMNWNKEWIAYLLKNNPEKIDIENKYGETPFMLAFNRGYHEIIKYLEENGANVNKQDIDGRTVLHRVVINDDVKSTQKLVSEYNANIDVQDKEERTALMHAAGRYHEEIAEFLIDTGANAGIRDIYGNTLLHMAAEDDLGLKVMREGDSRLLKLILEKCSQYEFDLEARNICGETPIMKALYINGVKFLVEEMGVNLNVKDFSNNTLLHKFARSYRGLDSLKYILEHEDFEYDVEFENDFEETALMAVDKPIVVKCLVNEKGARLDVRNNNGDGLLHKTVQNNNLELTRFYVNEYGIEVDAVNKRGETPLMNAVSLGYRDMAQYLIEACKADAHITDSNENTLLHKAAESNDLGIVKLLVLKYTLDQESRNARGEQPYELATDEAVIRFLLGGKEVPIEKSEWRVIRILKSLFSASEG